MLKQPGNLTRRGDAKASKVSYVCIRLKAPSLGGLNFHFHPHPQTSRCLVERQFPKRHQEFIISTMPASNSTPLSMPGVRGPPPATVAISLPHRLPKLIGLVGTGGKRVKEASGQSELGSKEEPGCTVLPF